MMMIVCRISIKNLIRVQKKIGLSGTKNTWKNLHP